MSKNQGSGSAARCAGEDPELFFGHGRQDGARPDRPLAWEQEALRVCRDCPVRVMCLAAALRADPGWYQFGVVGGTTAAQRHQILMRELR